MQGRANVQETWWSVQGSRYGALDHHHQGSKDDSRHGDNLRLPSIRWNMGLLRGDAYLTEQYTVVFPSFVSGYLPSRLVAVRLCTPKLTRTRLRIELAQGFLQVKLGKLETSRLGKSHRASKPGRLL